MVTEDIKSGVRTITQLSINNNIGNKGIFRTIKTELFNPNAVNSVTDVVDTDVVSKVYDNFQQNNSSSVFGNIAFDKIISTLADGTKVFSFNENLQLNFTEAFDCDGDSYIGKVFYIDHNVECCRITFFAFTTIEGYDETARVKIFVEDNLIFDHLITEITNPKTKQYRLLEFIDLMPYYKTRSKWQIFITDNKNTESYGKLIMNFESTPPNAITKEELLGKPESENFEDSGDVPPTPTT